MKEAELQQFKDEMKEHVAETIRVVVNGKLDKLSLKMDDYITDDEAWKVRAEPVIKAFENSTWLWQLFIGTLKLFGLVGVGVTAFVLIKNLFK